MKSELSVLLLQLLIDSSKLICFFFSLLLDALLAGKFFLQLFFLILNDATVSFNLLIKLVFGLVVYFSGARELILDESKL